jgi:S1-C subfamily serine protease
MIALPNALIAAALCIFPGEGWLGVILSSADVRPTILEVVPDSPAARAGLLPGDVVVAIDRSAIASVDAFVAALGARSAGARVQLTVERAGRDLVLPVTLAAPPGEEVPPAKPAEPAPVRTAHGPAYLGIRVSDEDGQVAVRELVPGGAAARAGLRAGDHLTKVARREVRSVEDLTQALRDLTPGQTVPVEIAGPEGTRVVDLCLDAAPRASAEADHPVPAEETAPATTPDVDLRDLAAELASLRQEVAELRALLESAAQRKKG